MDTPMPEAVKKIIVKNVNEVEEVASQVDFVFSAVDMSKDEIKKIEEDYAKTETPVVSNNSAHRWTPDVPMVVPEINPQHKEVIKYQKERLGTKRGFVAVKPNCSIQSYAPVLTAWKEFEPYEVVATTYQAISGAGKTFKDWPEMVGNIIPFIGGEEEKSEKEPLRLWGYVDDEKKQIVPATIKYQTSLAESVNAIKAASSALDTSVQEALMADISVNLKAMYVALAHLEEVTNKAEEMEEGAEQGHYYHDVVFAAMDELRKPADKLEMLVAKSAWPFPSYGDLPPAAPAPD